MTSAETGTSLVLLLLERVVLLMFSLFAVKAKALINAQIKNNFLILF
jgi:hypothetical protein